jgi:hypothetical protein
MRGKLLGLLCVLPWLSQALSAARAAEPAPTLRDQLLHTTQALLDAIPAGDKSVWNASLADNAILVDEFGRISSKAETIASLHPFPTGFSGSIALRHARVEQYGDTAVLQVEEDERETVFGQNFSVHYQSLLTFVKQSGDWKVVGYEDVTIPTAPPKLAVTNLMPGDYTGSYAYAPNHRWTVSNDHGVLSYTTRPGGQANVLQPLARDVFMGSDDERNILIFHRTAQGVVDALIERRKFNDFRLMKTS